MVNSKQKLYPLGLDQLEQGKVYETDQGKRVRYVGKDTQRSTDKVGVFQELDTRKEIKLGTSARFRKAGDIQSEPPQDVRPEMKMTFGRLKLKEIHTDKFSLRFSDQPSSRLRESVSKVGIKEPLTVAQVDGEYQLVDGFRRFKLANELGYPDVPVKIIEGMSKGELKELALVLNINKKTLSALEIAWTVYRHYKEGLSLERISDIIGMSIGRVSELKDIFKLPSQVLEKVEGGEIGVSQAVLLKGLKPEDQIDVLEQIKGRKVSYREFKVLVGKKKETQSAVSIESIISRLEELEFKAKKEKNGTFKIVLTFSTVDEYRHICGKLNDAMPKGSRAHKLGSQEVNQKAMNDV